VNFKNKWFLGTSIVFFFFLFVCIFICVIEPFLHQTYLYWRLAKIDVAPVLIQEGDLPSGFTVGKIKKIEPDYFQWTEAKEQEILASDGTKIGTVGVYLFASGGDQSEMYSMYSQVESEEGIIPYEVTGIGDQCESCTPVFSKADCDINIVFTRCTALGVIELYPQCLDKQYNFDYEYIIAHAKRLDESLKSIACY
jgi:hypothetical protein